MSYCSSYMSPEVCHPEEEVASTAASWTSLPAGDVHTSQSDPMAHVEPPVRITVRHASKSMIPRPPSLAGSQGAVPVSQSRDTMEIRDKSSGRPPMYRRTSAPAPQPISTRQQKGVTLQQSWNHAFQQASSSAEMPNCNGDFASSAPAALSPVMMSESARSDDAESVADAYQEDDLDREFDDDEEFLDEDLEGQDDGAVYSPQHEPPAGMFLKSVQLLRSTGKHSVFSSNNELPHEDNANSSDEEGAYSSRGSTTAYSHTSGRLVTLLRPISINGSAAGSLKGTSSLILASSASSVPGLRLKGSRELNEEGSGVS